MTTIIRPWIPGEPMPEGTTRLPSAGDRPVDRRLHLTPEDAAALAGTEQPGAQGDQVGTEEPAVPISPAASAEPDVIVGYIDPSGAGEGNWAAYEGLSPLEQWHADGDR